MEWYEKAASKNNANAQYDLGILYFYGRGVHKDYNKAFE
jgi:TPR repeat protein